MRYKKRRGRRMCSRFYIDKTEETRPYVQAAADSPLASRMVDRLGRPLKTEGEIFPTDMVPVIATSRSRRQTVFPMVWGFRLKGLDRPVINARSETAPVKISFKEAWEKRRCAVPASWYYEWEHYAAPDGTMKAGDKYAIQPAGETAMYLAGLYRMQRYRDLDYPVFAVLTRAPSVSVRSIHDRMPVVLPPERIPAWINPDSAADEIRAVLDMALTDMVAEKEEKRRQ